MSPEKQPPKSNGNQYNTRMVLQCSVFAAVILFCLTPFASAPIALLAGIVVALTIGNPFVRITQKLTHILLQVSVVGLGFGMNATTALKAGREGFLFTVFSIISVLVLGYLSGKALRLNKKISFLISVGTAICGGSAIAAAGPAIKAEEKEMSVALGTIFILNAIALLAFPAIGHFLNLSQNQFGIWSAIAIQDTSSVVGAAGKYGDPALQIATTVKLTRALWIIPVAFMSAFLFKSKETKIKFPYFILLFIVAIIMNTYLPGIQKVSGEIVYISKTGLTVTLFLIGSALSGKILSSVGFKPILQGIILWIFISLSALCAVVYFA